MTGFFIFSVAFVFGGIRVDAPILVKVDFKMFFFAAVILSVPTGAMRMVVLSMLMVMRVLMSTPLTRRMCKVVHVF